MRREIKRLDFKAWGWGSALTGHRRLQDEEEMKGGVLYIGSDLGAPNSGRLRYLHERFSANR